MMRRNNTMKEQVTMENSRQTTLEEFDKNLERE